jgi:hypothetical protein
MHDVGGNVDSKPPMSKRGSVTKRLSNIAVSGSQLDLLTAKRGRAKGGSEDPIEEEGEELKISPRTVAGRRSTEPTNK